MVEYVYNDGGREAAGYKGHAGDCACRAIAIAAELPYQQVYDLINEVAKSERTGKRKKGVSNARTGVYRSTFDKVMEKLGWKWQPTMQIGKGCSVHVRADELPAGRLILSLSKHYSVMIDGVVHDTHDPSREGTRCVYGYFYKPEPEPVENFEWNDELAYEFSIVATRGAYGLYKGCKSTASKLERFKRVKSNPEMFGHES